MKTHQDKDAGREGCDGGTEHNVHRVLADAIDDRKDERQLMDGQWVRHK